MCAGWALEGSLIGISDWLIGTWRILPLGAVPFQYFPKDIRQSATFHAISALSSGVACWILRTLLVCRQSKFALDGGSFQKEKTT